ncbi:MAG TPA: hypothetical protein VF469_30955 [Kofleriaceae bacterium]
MSSPSLMHEGVIALVRDNPAFAASLLRDLLHVHVPRFDQARLTEAALPQLIPVEYHADAVVLFVDFVDERQQPVLGTIFEVQLERKARKRYTWPLYAVAARARYECPFLLTVVTPDRRSRDGPASRSTSATGASSHASSARRASPR